MQNSFTHPLRSHRLWIRALVSSSFLSVSFLSVGLLGWTSDAMAQTPTVPRPAPAATPAPAPATPPAPATATDAPARLVQTLSQIDAAANQGNLQTVMAFYSPQFTNSDGLNYTSYQEALQKFWQRYPGMTYQTQINSWERDGNAIVVETTTTIRGTQQTSGRPQNLTATIASLQRFEGFKIVSQEILSERSEVTIGTTPPTVELRLPTQVNVGRNFSLDAVVQEPLGDRLLLGAALAEPINAEGYLNAVPIELELLSSGGLFKVGRAPIAPENRWISAILVRDDGITAVTQRMQIINRGSNTGNR